MLDAINLLLENVLNGEYAQRLADIIYVNDFDFVYIPRPNISFQTLTHKTVRTCRYYKFLQHNSQRVYVNYTETK